MTAADAFRFLNQASFGAAPGEVAALQQIGLSKWFDEQAALRPSSVRAEVEAARAAARTVGQGEVMNGLWKQYLSSPAQLRWRVAHAWSQIFVISLVDGAVHSEPRAAGHYVDMLAEKGLGNFRDLLEAVALHPMMGQYLSHRGNRKADHVTGRTPDENFAREVMQLFTIGLHRLRPDGRVELDAEGQPIPTYSQADVAGLAKVFTGFSWSCPDGPLERCFRAGSPRFTGDPDSDVKPMMAYPQHHSTEAKRFLGRTIPAQADADPRGSLKLALDHLFAHPNVGPFIGRQLIQRLVSSNPSPAYVRAVAEVFADNGRGVRGDLQAVMRAVLLHPEARDAGANAGKLREPILRFTALARAFPMQSESGRYGLGNTEDPALQLGQAPLRAPSVFNFYRPGFVPSGGPVAARQWVAPEMQLVHETSVAGYIVYLRRMIGDASSPRLTVDPSASVARSDPDFGFGLLQEFADRPEELVDEINSRLFGGEMSSGLRQIITKTVADLPLPRFFGGDLARQKALKTRADAALLLAAASPEFVRQP